MFTQLKACAGTLAALTTSLHAGVHPALEARQAEAAPDLSGNAGITVVNQYITRGYIVQDEGTSFQPHLDLNANFYQGDGFIDSASVFLGLWGVVSSTRYDGGSNRFTEFDYGPGITVSFAERWTFTAFYNRWTSPADAFADGHWLSGAIEFDDSWLLHENFSLKPFFEATQDLDFSGMAGFCLETGIRPETTFFPESSTPVTAALLIMTGLGNGYYGEDYGYLAIGPQISAPLTFIDSSAGSWTVTAECLYHDFNSSLAEFNGSRHDVVFSLGVNVGF